jgi:hypothetical protein
MDEASYSQKFGRHSRKPEEWERNGNVKPVKVPARASRYEKRSGQKFENFFPNAHDSYSTLPVEPPIGAAPQ